MANDSIQAGLKMDDKHTMIHLPFHVHTGLSCSGIAGGSSGHWVRRGARTGQVTSLSQGNTETHRTNNFQQQINLTGLWEEAGVLGGNPHMHGKNMEMPCRKTSEFRSQDLLSARHIP
ncbi:hypothetical protein CRENBAI_012284 [Crenichthys baileyi]|uniref:Uncharacterized protein n=1 Tax=Crenichthys baileyi TaxID=28760 RepID=A0AAV9RRK6_9TELE